MEERITTAGVLEKDGRYLVGLRIKGGAIGGRWEFPGGKNRWGETEADTLRREWMEELNLAITVGELVTASDFVNKEMLYHLRAYVVFCNDLSPMTLHFHTETRFLSLEEMENLPFAPSDRTIIAALAEAKGSLPKA